MQPPVPRILVSHFRRVPYEHRRLASDISEEFAYPGDPSELEESLPPDSDSDDTDIPQAADSDEFFDKRTDTGLLNVGTDVQARRDCSGISGFF
jgi:hypothetical protein